MNCFTRLSVCLATLVVPSAYGANAPDDALAAEVRCAEISFSLSVERKDIDAFASLIDADARFVSDVVTRGSEAVVENWSGFFVPDGPEIAWRPQFIEVLKSGDLALSRGPYRMRVANDDLEIDEFWGTYNSVWRKNQHDQWHIVFDAGNAASEPPPDDVQQLFDESVADCDPG